MSSAVRIGRIPFRLAPLVAAVAAICTVAAAPGVAGEWSASFDGERLVGLSNPGWAIGNGAITMPGDRKVGRVGTTAEFGDAQVHLDWSPPDIPLGSNSGNSGVFFGPYEVQILDSYQQRMIGAERMAGAIYGQYAPTPSDPGPSAGREPKG